MITRRNYSFSVRWRWLLLLLGSGILTANGAVTLTIPGIPGNSTIPGYSGAIDVQSFSHELARDVSLNQNTKTTVVSPASHSEIAFTKQTDSTTPLLYDAATHGTAIPSAEIDFFDTSKNTTLFYKVLLNQVYVTGVSTSSGSSIPQDSFSLFYQKITWSYIRVDGGDNTATWDRISNTGTNNLAGPDSDSDGLPDPWEMLYFGNLSYGPNDDPDHDGLSNYQEYLAGTNPNDANSVLRVTDVGAGSGQVSLTWNSVAGKTYTIYGSSQINGPYTPLLTVPSAGDGVTSTNITGSASGQFYRVGTP